jgi:hypothetical protein
MKESIMNNITIVVLILFLAIWIYTITSVFTSEFKDKKAKVFWKIGLIFVPFLAFFYLFMKKDLVK